MQQASNTMRTLNRELGIRQMARDKLGMEAPKELDEMEMLIFGLNKNGKKKKAL